MDSCLKMFKNSLFCLVDTHALEWKLCKSMKSKSSLVLDVQFGVSRKSLKMVRASVFFFLR